MLIELDTTEIETIADMLRDYRAEVARGNIIPAQSQAEELVETDELIGKLELALRTQRD